MSQVFFKYHEDVNSDRIFPSKTFAIHVTSQRKALLISSSFTMLSREISNAWGAWGACWCFYWQKSSYGTAPYFFNQNLYFCLNGNNSWFRGKTAYCKYFFLDHFLPCSITQRKQGTFNTWFFIFFILFFFCYLTPRSPATKQRQTMLAYAWVIHTFVC